MSLLFRRAEQRAVSFQQVWGTGADTLNLSPDQYRAVEAVGLSAVRACVGLKARTLAQLPFSAYRTVDGFSQEIETQPTLIAAPSGKTLRSRWLTQYSVSQDLWGNSYGHIVAWDAAGWPTQVEWLNPDEVICVESTGSPVEYRVNGQPFPTERMMHVAEFTLPGKVKGLAPLERSGLVDLGKRAQQFGQEWFRNGAVPSSIIYSDQHLDASQADDLVDKVTSKWRHRKPAVLGSGLKYAQVSVAANESQFAETITSVQVQVCQAQGVPPEKIGVASSGSSVTYANREQSVQQFLTDTINDRVVVLQEVLTATQPLPVFVRFNTGALLRSDLKTRMESYKVAREARVQTPNQSRGIEDMPPIEGGDEFDTLTEKVNAVGALVRAGFDPSAALAATGMPPIEHTGYVPITVNVPPEALLNNNGGANA